MSTRAKEKTEERKTQPFANRSSVKELSAIASESAREQIERRAYELYIARGGAHGNDLDDWLQAEQEFYEQSE